MRMTPSNQVGTDIERQLFPWCLVAVCATCLCLVSCKPKAVPRAPTVIGETTAESGTAYVSDQKCSECHADIATQFAGHSMGQSLAIMNSNAVADVLSSAATNKSFEADGFRYSVLTSNGALVHRQARIDSDGNEMAVVELPVDIAVGSGHHGKSYLVNREGYLFMSPLTWYPDKQVWDLSPGFEKKNSEFNRPIIEICLFCHSNRAVADSNSINHYREPVFEGHSIGCQRCHGPGEQHVAAQESGSNDATDSIVNPTKLPVAEREAVCQQCHLSGAARVTKAGKTLYDYRPGETLNSTYSVYTLRPDLLKSNRFVGQVEQMYASRCFTASDGALGCISCHDPHQLPTADQRIEFYRQRCLNCHGEQDCAEPMPLRRQKSAEDSCMVCHMPSQETEIRHAATTDHRILRRAGTDSSDVRRVAKPRNVAELPIVRFPPPPGDHTSHKDSIDRDLALAVVLASRHESRCGQADPLSKGAADLGRSRQTEFPRL